MAQAKGSHPVVKTRSGKGNPLVLHADQQTIGALGILFGVAAVAIAFAEKDPRCVPPLAYVVLGTFFLVNVSVFFERRFQAYFPRLGVAVFLFNMGSLSTFLILADLASTDWIIAICLMVIMASLGQNPWTVVAATLAIGLVYGYLQASEKGPSVLLSVPFLLRISFFFVTGLFVGYLSEMAHREWQMQRKLELARTQLGLAGRIIDAVEDKLREKEKFSIVGRLIAGLEKDLTVPLRQIRSSVALLREAVDRDNLSCKQPIERILEMSEQMETLLADLKGRRASQTDVRAKVNLNELIGKELDDLSDNESWRHVAVNFRPLHDLPSLEGNPNTLTAALEELLVNAFDAMDGRGVLSVVTGFDPASKQLYVQVADTGRGIEPEILDQIFFPYFTTKDGLRGLGLYLARTIVRDHHGQIDVQSQLGKGAIFTLRFQVSEDKVNVDRELLKNVQIKPQ